MNAETIRALTPVFLATRGEMSSGTESSVKPVMLIERA
jgi:hypothetical protein